MSSITPIEDPNPSAQGFATTSWSLIVRAGDESQSRPALEDLCRRYWQPVYSWLKRSGLHAADAEDATQSFFGWLLESNLVTRADPARGRFRTFLIVALKQFLARRREFENAAKRNPGRRVVSLSLIEAETGLRYDPYHHETPDRQFDYSWTLALIDLAMRRLKAEWEKAGREGQFEALKGQIVGDSSVSGRELAVQLGLSEGAARVAVHRLRKRFGEIFRDEVAQTLGTLDDLEEELGYLLQALRSTNRV